MPTFLPEDDNDNVIPALRLRPSGAHAITSSATSARNTTPFSGDTRVISLYATQAVYIAFGDSNVTATNTSHYFPAGVYYDLSIGGEKTRHYTHMAVLRVDTNGTIYISEKE